MLYDVNRVEEGCHGTDELMYLSGHRTYVLQHVKNYFDRF
jgi:hypothetical protein